MSNIYGGNALGVNISVYTNTNNSTAKDWFLNVYGGGSPTAQDIVSTASINGYDTYYYQQMTSVYHEINYTYSSSGKVVLITSRVLEGVPDLANSTKRDDITSYIPDITTIAKSVAIK